MKCSFLLFCFYILFSKCSSNDILKDKKVDKINNQIATVSDTSKISSKRNKTKRNFDEILDSAFVKLRNKEELSPDFIERCFPKTQNEFITFYSLTNKKPISLFNKLDKLLYNNASNGYGDSFLLFLNMSEFVDGEYAESYYDGISDFILEQKELFCKRYSELSKTAKEKFMPEKKEYCP